MKRIHTLLLLGIVCSASAYAGEFSIRGWQGKAYFDDETGEFSHCAISNEYESGTRLIFSITKDGEFVLGFSNRKWRFRIGDRYPVNLFVDRRDLGRYEAVANTENAVFVFLPYSEDLIRLLRKGRALQIDASRETLRYELTGTSAALPRVQDCVYRELFTKQLARNPFASDREWQGSRNPFGAGNSRRSAGTTDEDSETVAMLLRKAEMDDYHFVPRSSRPDYLSDAVYVWTNGDVVGALFGYGLGEFEIGLMTSFVLSGYEESCDGQFDYGAKTAQSFDGTPMRRVFAKCVEKGGEIVMSFLFFEVNEDLAVVVHVADGSFATELGRADDGVFRAFSGN